VTLWDELWWDDGQLHSQPVLDGVGEPTLWSPAKSAVLLLTALGVVGGAAYLAAATAPAQVWAPQQYPPDVQELFDRRRQPKQH